MRVGVGLPASVPDTPGRTVIEWARQADCGPFSSLGVLDRLVYRNFESLTTLAAAAAVTTRIRLATTIVIAPLRNTSVLAKQAATVDALSEGRLVLGLGVGARADDYAVSGSDYASRGKRLTSQLTAVRDWWEDPAHGPASFHGEGPTLLVGGDGGPAMSRMARYADGHVHGGGPARAFARSANEALAAWTDYGRPGRPQLWGMAYFALGEESVHGHDYLRDYYAFTGAFADRIAAGLLATPAAIQTFLSEYEEAGCDELILFPALSTLDQVERLAEVLRG